MAGLSFSQRFTVLSTKVNDAFCYLRSTRLMISDRDVWAAAVVMVKGYGDDAMLEAATRAGARLDAGDMAGCEVWQRIVDAIERLQAKAPAKGERVH